jgi:hypothetical protein
MCKRTSGVRGAAPTALDPAVQGIPQPFRAGLTFSDGPPGLCEKWGEQFVKFQAGSASGVKFKIDPLARIVGTPLLAVFFDSIIIDAP